MGNWGLKTSSSGQVEFFSPEGLSTQKDNSDFKTTDVLQFIYSGVNPKAKSGDRVPMAVTWCHL